MWEFKHGNGNFKRGDMIGLREIRRRASRHALVHREYNNQRAPPSQPGTPAEPVAPMQETANPRLNNIEHTLFDLSTRLQRHEENAQFMQVKHQAIMETVARLLQFNHELSRAVLALVPSPDNPMYRDGKCWPALPQVWWYQYSLIFLRSPSLGPAVRGPAADGYVPHPRRAPRTGFCELPPVLLQRRERSRVAASITPR
jgi:hypothetical protein